MRTPFFRKSVSLLCVRSCSYSYSIYDDGFEVTVGTPYHLHLRVILMTSGALEVRDATLTAPGRRIGGRRYGEPFRGSYEAREAVRVALCGPDRDPQ